jgi:serine/threonine protein kinase
MTNPAKANSGVKLISEQGEYELGELIGKGGMGSVYEVLRMGKLYGARVIKILHGALALTEEDCERLVKEGQIAFQIVHPNLVAVMDIGMFGDAPFIVMERVDGVDLRKFLATVEEPVDLDICDFIIGEGAGGLTALHDYKIGPKDAGVVHSDITRGNILISSSGQVKLTDFGIARFAHNDGTRSRPIGTPLYMSPEQRLGKTPRATDLFSLGMIFWELLEGGDKHYLGDLNELQRTQAMLNGYIPPFTRPGIPEHSVMLCRRMLSPDPEKRPLAREVREIILNKRPHYMLAAGRLAELYMTHWPKRTGMTKLLNTADFFRQVTPESSPIKLALESAFAAPSAPPNERTVADSAEPDAPSVLRRMRSPTPSRSATNEPTPGSATRVTAATGTETPRSRMRAPGDCQQAPGLDRGPELPPMLVHEGAPASSSGSADNLAAACQPGPAWESTDEPGIEPTVVLDPPTFAEPSGGDSPADAIDHPIPPSIPVVSEPSTPVVSEPSTPVVSEPSTPIVSERLASAPVTELRRRTAALWAVAASGGVLIILVGVLLAMVATGRVGVSPTTANADGEAQEAEPVPTANVGPVVSPPVESPVETVPTVELTGVETDLKTGPETDATVESDPTVEKTTADPGTKSTGEQVPEVGVDKAKKPKPAPKPTLVGFLFPGEAEVEIGKIKIKGTKFATKELAPKTYPVRWRTLPDGEWHSVGDLTVKELPPDKAYQVTLSTSNMSVRDDARRGSK